jgi:hypothetical protein
LRELSLHILDIMQNSIAAGASRVEVIVEADERTNSLSIRIADNGSGMEPEFAEKVLDPFVTTRTTRRVGLGLPLLAAAAELCGGSFRIETRPGEGTTIEASFVLDHVDRMPFGDIASTMINTIVAHPDISFMYRQSTNGREFVLDTDEIRAQLQDVPISEPSVVRWLREYMQQLYVIL